MAAKDDPTDKGDLLGVLRRDIDEKGTAGPKDRSVKPPAAGGDRGLDAGARRQEILERLDTVVPLPVPSVAISLAGRSATEVGRLLRALPAQMDPIVGRYAVKLEVRLDLLPGFSERINALALVLQLGVPVIATLRSKTEGGASAQTDAERQQFLLTALNALRNDAPAGSLIDVEANAVAADPEGWAQVIGAAQERGFALLLSHHDLEVSPERASRLLPPEGLLDGAPGGGALIWKSASKARTWEQVLALLRAARRGNLQARRAALMGLDDPVVRLLAPWFGMPLVYAAPDADHLAAPGQLPFRSLVHAWARWGVRHDDIAFAATVSEEDDDAVPDDGSPVGPRDQDRRLARRHAPRLALLGRPAWHSLSPAMHNAVARAEALPHRYLPLELPPHIGTGNQADVVRHTMETLRDMGVVGGNVTIPFKEHLLQLADDIDDEARAIGAANTFRFEGTKTLVTNTDAEGIRDVLADHDRSLHGKTVLVLGAGGSARAACHAVRDAERVIVSNRTPERAHELVERLANDAGAAFETAPWDERHTAAGRADIVIHCTSVGMAGTKAADEDVLDGVTWRADQTVIDLVYAVSATNADDDAAPSFLTPLLRAAQDGGAHVIDGLDVLVAQGARAFAWWTETKPDRRAMREAAEAAAKIPLDPLIRASYERCEVIA